MNVLITGGAGYIGTELIYKLAVNPAISKIVVFDNLSRSNYNLFIGPPVGGEKIEFVKGELLDSRGLKKVLKGIDVVYHLAARVTTPFADQDPHLFEQVNNWGTAELVYAVEESKVSKFIYLSSTSVYGAASETVDLNTSPNPRTFYGISKLRGEDHVARLLTKIPTYILRCGNVYGYSPSMRFDAVINRFMFEANFQKRISIHGDGKQGRAFIHVDKATAVLQGLMQTELKAGYYNLVDKNISVRELAEEIKDLLPETEMIFINQHMKLRELAVQPDERITKAFKLKETSLREELQAFKERMAFGPQVVITA